MSQSNNNKPEQSQYNKNNPFLASIIERYDLCKPGSDKNIAHVVIDLKGSGLTYKVGDSIAIQPINDPEIVDKTLHAIGALGDESVVEKNNGVQTILREYLTKKANLAEVPRKLISELIQRQTDSIKKSRLENLLAEGQKEALKEYQAAHEVWDALEENREAIFSPQELVNLLMPLLPRFYSIASSMLSVGEEVHLTVAELIYETKGIIRRGVCTHYLCKLAPMYQKVVPIYIHPSNGFTLPENTSAPIIMIGPGTGIAPFRAFMQEREVQKAKGFNWLFFGERHRDLQFLYEDYWEELVAAEKMRLDTAFSRDQNHKIYVQHRMLEHGAEFFRQLDSGAYVYVCGDAHRMAKDVDAALHHIIQLHGGFDEQGAKDYIKKLKAAKRYLRDVY